MKSNFAELYVAGILADKGWDIYFPHRDKGFDFIISKQVNGFEIFRPVQVKGKYPTFEKTDKDSYGFVGELSKINEQMVLVIPFFDNSVGIDEILIAFMPYEELKKHSRGYRCEPAKFSGGKITMKPKYEKYFNDPGLALLQVPV